MLSPPAEISGRRDPAVSSRNCRSRAGPSGGLGPGAGKDTALALPGSAGAARAPAPGPQALGTSRGSVPRVAPGKTPRASLELFAQKGAGVGWGEEAPKCVCLVARHPHTLLPFPAAPAFPSRVPGPQNPLWRKATCCGDAGCGARESRTETCHLRQRGFRRDCRGLPPRCVFPTLSPPVTPEDSGRWLSHTAGRPWRAEGGKEQLFQK